MLERRWWLLYPAWILLCGALFVILQGAADPSRPAGRIEQNRAAEIAIRHLQRADATHYSGFEAVDTSFRRGEGGSQSAAWLVLCDSTGKSTLREAVVVEVDASSGKVLRVRSPQEGASK
jgi:hypothetical protein